MLFCTLVILASFAGGSQAVKSPERPVVPNVTVISTTEMKITWCRVNSNNVEINYYELEIDGHLEYSGIDVVHVAKRLKPWTWYDVKLRACGFFAGSCSPYSIPVLAKTLRDSKNATVIQSGVSLVKVVALPTYAFVLGVFVGVLMLSLGILWRYFQTTEWMVSHPFELQQLIKASETDLRSVSQEKYGGNNQSFSRESLCNTAGSNSSVAYPGTKGYQTESHVAVSEGSLINVADTIDPSLLEYENSSIVCTTSLKELERSRTLYDYYKVCPSVTKSTLQQQITACSPAMDRGKNVQLNDNYMWYKDEATSKAARLSDENQELLKCEKGVIHSLVDVSKVHDIGVQHVLVPQTATSLQGSPLYEDKQTETENFSLPAAAGHAIDEEHCKYPKSRTSELPQSHYSSMEITDTTATDVQNATKCLKHHPVTCAKTDGLKEVSLSTTAADTCTGGIIVAIDNSNIYIGAQESASAVNTGDRKRNVRLRIQNLVRILEQNRPKTRGFACGSSSHATEQVWEVYRRLGYTVDLEERRGKDEQRVDEGLHLCIYKALCELSPGVLVLATGDGMKGKSEHATSFPGCATNALERGWSVELHSWKHSLSAEWNKLAKRYPERLKIFYLDKYVNHVTFVDGKNGRKSLHVPVDFTM